MASSRRERVGILIAAILFFVASFGSTALVLWQLGQEDNSPQVQEETMEEKKMADFTPVENVDKLEVIEQQEGNGSVVKEGDTVTVHYTGALTKNGVVFDSSLDRGQPATFPLQRGGLIEGWIDGMIGMKEGGKRRLLIPSALAYGENGRPPVIGPNEALVFDIELIRIEKQ